MGKDTFFNKAGGKIQKVSKTISAIIVIIGALTGVFSWVSNKFQEAVLAQISDFQDEVREADKSVKRSSIRLELLMLMEHDPHNNVAIEKMARYYFINLDGDLYMTQKFSQWAKEYGGDTTIVIGEE